MRRKGTRMSTLSRVASTSAMPSRQPRVVDIQESRSNQSTKRHYPPPAGSQRPSGLLSSTTILNTCVKSSGTTTADSVARETSVSYVQSGIGRILRTFPRTRSDALRNLSDRMSLPQLNQPQPEGRSLGLFCLTGATVDQNRPSANRRTFQPW